MSSSLLGKLAPPFLCYKHIHSNDFVEQYALRLEDIAIL